MQTGSVLLVPYAEVTITLVLSPKPAHSHSLIAERIPRRRVVHIVYEKSWSPVACLAAVLRSWAAFQHSRDFIAFWLAAAVFCRGDQVFAHILQLSSPVRTSKLVSGRRVILARVCELIDLLLSGPLSWG